MNPETTTQNYQELMQLKEMNKGKNIASTIFGVISVLACLGPISFLSGIIAIIVGIVARKKSQGTAGTAGFVLGIIGTILSLIATVAMIIPLLISAGVIAPQFIRYTEKSKQSSDYQLCSEVQIAINVSIADNFATDYENIAKYADGEYHNISELYKDNSTFASYFRDCISCQNAKELNSRIKSTKSGKLQFYIDTYSGAEVRISGTDISVP